MREEWQGWKVDTCFGSMNDATVYLRSNLKRGLKEIIVVSPFDMGGQHENISTEKFLRINC